MVTAFITISFVVTIVGLVLYLPSINPKVNEVGRIMFFAGLLGMLLSPLGARPLL